MSSKSAVTKQSNAVVVNVQKIQEFAIRFRACAKKSVGETLEVCKVLAQAKAQLSKKEFVSFCSEVRINPSKSTFRKYECIANAEVRFSPYLERLPNSWTTLYELTKLDPAVFEQLALANAITPELTALRLKTLLNPKATKKSASKRAPWIKLSFEDTVSTIAIFEVYRELRLRAPSMSCELICNTQAKEMIQAYERAMHEPANTVSQLKLAA